MSLSYILHRLRLINNRLKLKDLSHFESGQLELEKEYLLDHLISTDK